MLLKMIQQHNFYDKNICIKVLKLKLDLQSKNYCVLTQQDKDTPIPYKYFNFSSYQQNMIFQYSPPLYIKQIDSNKMILLTKYRIIYAFIDKPLQSFYSILVQQNPLQLQYSHERQEALVFTERSLQIYTCDFSHEVGLKKVIILNQQCVYSVLKGNPKEWQVYGQIYQYSAKNIKIHSIQQRSVQEEAVGFCFIQQFEVLIGKNKNLTIYDHNKQTQHQIKWNQQTQQVGLFLKNTKKSPFKLKGYKLYVPKYNNKQLPYSMKQCKSQLLASQKSQSFKKQKSGIFSSKRSGSQFYSNLVIGQEDSRLTNSFVDIKSFVLILELDSRFIIALIPPQTQYQKHIRKQSTILSEKNSVKGGLRAYVAQFKQSKNQNLQSKWQIKKLNLHSNSSMKLKILHSSTYRHFDHQSFITAQQMIKKNLFLDKQLTEQVDQVQGVWTMSKIQNKLIFALIKLQCNENFNHQQQIKSGVEQNPSKSFHVQSYTITENHLPKNSEQNDQQQFIDMVLSLAQVKNDKISPKSLLELIDVEHRDKSTNAILTFLYYIPSNKSKTLLSIKLKAQRLPYQKFSGIQSSIKNMKSTNVTKSQGKGMFSQNKEQNYMQNIQKFTISNPPVIFQNTPLSYSQSLSNISPISGSQQITLTYSDDTQLTTTQILSKLPSTRSLKQQNLESQHQKHEKISKSQKYKTNSPTSFQQQMNPLKQSRNRGQLSSSIPSKISPESKSFMQSIQQVAENRGNSYRPTSIAIKEVSEEHWNEESCSKLEEEEVQEVMEIVDFKPAIQNRSFGVAVGNSSQNQSQNSSKVVEKLRFDMPNDDQKRLLKKNSLQSNKKSSQIQKIDPFNSKKSISNVIPTKHQGLDISLENQTQEHQFYQKFINHFDSKRQVSQDPFTGMRDSREQESKQFRNSKVSGDDPHKKEKMHKMIGRDISQILNGKNLMQSADEEVYCSDEETVELGEEIEKEYSRTMTKNGKKISNQDQHAGQGLFSKHNISVSQSEPTVILLDKLDNSMQNNKQQSNSPQYQNTSNDQVDLNIPNTPGFNFDFHHFDNNHLFRQPQIGIVSNDHWSNFNKKWNMTTNQQYNKNDEFNLKESKVSLKGNSLKSSTFMKDSRNNLVTKKQYEKLSKKVKAFCQDPEKLTWDQAREIEANKITQLMREMFIRSQEKFNILMKEFLSQIIREEQARLFFAEYIRTFSGKTRDILVRLYMSLPENEDNKKWMSKALSEFNLSQVPQICLPISKDILQIFKFLYPSVFIEDLLKPSIPLYQKLLENYFVLQRLPVDQITIEDEAIDLSHPRNMLNILLYLNESYSLSMTQLFEVYCTELIKNNCAEIVVKMLKEEQTFEICEVSKAILEDIVEKTIIQKLKECSANIQWVGKGLQIFDCNISQTALKKKAQLSILLNVIDTLNLSDCFFSFDTLFKLSEIKNLFVFCNTLIRQNNVINLQKLNFPQMYRELHEIAYEQKLKYYNQQLKDLMEILCEKYFQNQSFRMAFYIIAPFITITKRGFVAKMLFKYMEGKLINRLSNKNFATKQQFMSTFREFFTGVTQSQRLLKQPTIEHDKFEFNSNQSYLVNCPYFKFYGMYSDCVHSTKWEEVIFVCYTDYQLATELATYHVLNKKEWQDLSEALNSYVPKEQIKKLVSKSVFKFNSRVHINEDEQQNQIQPSSSFIMKESEFLHIGRSKKQQNKHIKSLQAIQFQEEDKRQMNTKKLNVSRSKSDSKVPQQSPKYKSPMDSIIQTLKYEVNPQSVKQTLNKLYQKQGSYTRAKDFLKALSKIDRQRFKICHYEKFKTVINLQLDFEVERLLPFELFFTQDYDKCYQLIKQNHLLKKLSIKNFWTVYIVMEIILSKGEEIVMLMVEKLVSQFKSENLGNIVNQILDKCRVTQQNLKLLAVRAEMEGQMDVAQRIKQRILQKSN